MSARRARPKRWEQWNRRPSRVSMSSLPRRQRYTKDSLDAVAEASMTAGESMGRRWAERDLFDALALDFLLRPDATAEDVLDLAAYVGGKAMAQHLDDFLMAERARRADPDTLRRIAEAIELGGEEGKRALEAVARELGVFPEADDDEARLEEERGWWSDVDDLAREVGVLADDEDKALWDSVPPHGSGMVVEIEQWLRDRGRWLDFLREHGDLPDEKDGGA